MRKFSASHWASESRRTLEKLPSKFSLPPYGPHRFFLCSREKRRQTRSPLFLELPQFRLGGRRLGRRLGLVVGAAALQGLADLASLRREPLLHGPRFGD